MGQDDETSSNPPVSGSAAPARASRSRQLRLAALLLLLVVVVTATVRVIVASGPPTWDELRERAGLTNRDRLIIGVKDDQPGVAQKLENGAFEGFDIDIAYMIAQDLGFDAPEVTLLSIESEDRARRQARDANGSFVTVDLVIASYSITEQRREQGVVFSFPYLETEQSVLTLASDPRQVASLRDLDKAKVCTLGTSTSEQRLREAGASPIGRNRIGQCVQALYDGEVDAVTTDAAILAGFVGPRPPGELPPATKLLRRKELRHWDIGAEAAEKWGVNTGPNPAMRDLVNLSLYQSAKGPDGDRWKAAFDRYLASEQQYSNPQQVAVGRQPEPEETVEVRQWPWERWALPSPSRPRSGGPTVVRARSRRDRRSSGC
ncbi:transporter substrate-binding domain-containing protein [Micromonospora peucetia]|uniref:Transporter substrate-binding domain-containing protein n=1 Tax=Micromonospora peucetia TaxID=47871 RepID=A0ABZ1EBN3_9ACTN|nr:transporter substrate-binding domain-containing protein [Micromonospora peucetia]MCX4390592.1 transporter substrate-binding domain-containing protein [Micromonospora peucetia]WSA31530.1 transporter substrate-binding domain-containing protein [Micromonospora peucetia]